MPEFDYTARELSGKQVAGTLTASSEQDALASLAARSLFPIQVALSEATRKQKASGTRRVSNRYLTVFYNQLADLLRSGVPLLRSLQLLEEQTSNPSLKFVVQDVQEQVADGSRLYEAMRRHPKAFNQLTVSMVRAGEEGGFLEEVLARIATFNDHQEELKGRVTGAMIYPIFLVIIGSAIVSVIMVAFVPEFEPIFERMKDTGQLPWSTTTLMGISHVIQDWWVILLVGLVAAIVALYMYLDTKEGQEKLDRTKLKTPGVGPITRNLAVARFCRMLGTLLRNGVPILQSLKIAKDASGNVVLSEAIGNAVENVSSGKSLAIPLRASGQFSKEIVEMISIGEEANNLENVLISIADNLEKYTSRRIDAVVRMLEPLLLLIMASVVTFVLSALLLPVLNMSSAF